MLPFTLETLLQISDETREDKACRQEIKPRTETANDRFSSARFCGTRTTCSVLMKKYSCPSQADALPNDISTK